MDFNVRELNRVTSGQFRSGLDATFYNHVEKHYAVDVA